MRTTINLRKFMNIHPVKKPLAGEVTILLETSQS